LIDGRGNGQLIATDRIFIGMGPFGLTIPQTNVMKIYYRLQQVNTMEFVGILQSQIT
jgi:hypothetical protein